MLKGSADGARIAPEDCALISITTQEGTCSLVFSSSFPFEDGANSLAAQSIAKTPCFSMITSNPLSSPISWNSTLLSIPLA